MGTHTETVRFALRPDAQAFDEMHVTTVPRYKESGLSGDEWRVSTQVDCIRKGMVIWSQRFNSVETACKYIASMYDEVVGKGLAHFGGDGILCDQEGCSDLATSFYRKRKDFDRNSGAVTQDPSGDVRCFCAKHKTRGDCGLDDADDNYEAIENPNGPRPEGVKPTILSIAMEMEPDLLAYIKEAGAMDWGIVEAKSDEDHLKDFANSLRLTREHFQQAGPQPLSGLYKQGSDTVMAHTGTSPKAAVRARILAGLWNALHAAATKV